MVEADEYAGNFDPYRPDVSILTSAEWDHPDVFADRGAVVDCFEAWLEGAAKSVVRPVVVANVADPGVAEVVARLDGWPGDVLAVGLGEAASDAGAASAVVASSSGAASEAFLGGTIVEADPAGTTLRLDGASLATPLVARLRLAGRHNAANAVCVAGAALALGVPPDAIAAALGTFGGVGRRLERKGEGRGVVVYDDYGHHPTAIRETLAALRQRGSGGQRHAQIRRRQCHGRHEGACSGYGHLPRGHRSPIERCHEGHRRDHRRWSGIHYHDD